MWWGNLYLGVGKKESKALMLYHVMKKRNQKPDMLKVWFILEYFKKSTFQTALWV